jgi:hypothetical protein
MIRFGSGGEVLAIGFPHSLLAVHNGRRDAQTKEGHPKQEILW